MGAHAEIINLRKENAKLRNKNIELRHHYRGLCVRDIKGRQKNAKLRKENIRLRKFNRKLGERHANTSARARRIILKLRKRSAATESSLSECNFRLWREKKIMAVQNLKLRAALDILRSQMREHEVDQAYKKVSARHDRYKVKSFHLNARIQALERKNVK